MMAKRKAEMQTMLAEAYVLFLGGQRMHHGQGNCRNDRDAHLRIDLGSFHVALFNGLLDLETRQGSA